MCLSSVYSESEGKCSLVMAKVANVEVLPNGILCRDFLGRTLSVDGHISKIDLENNAIICKKEIKQRG